MLAVCREHSSLSIAGQLHLVRTAPVSSAPPWSRVPRAWHRASGAPWWCQLCCASTWPWTPGSATRALRLRDSRSAVGSAGGWGEQQRMEAAGSRQSCGTWAARGLGAGIGCWLAERSPPPVCSHRARTVHAVLLTLALLSAAPECPCAVSAAVLPVPVPRSGPRVPLPRCPVRVPGSGPPPIYVCFPASIAPYSVSAVCGTARHQPLSVLHCVTV